MASISSKWTSITLLCLLPLQTLAYPGMGQNNLYVRDAAADHVDPWVLWTRSLGIEGVDVDTFDLDTRDAEDDLDTQNMNKRVNSNTVWTKSTAKPGSKEAYDDWKAAGPNDVRSPCPGLNSLANHNLIPRSGKDITVPMIVSAAKDYLGMTERLAGLLAKAGLSSTGKKDAFNLNDLTQHGPIEHDGSLSRQDSDVDPSQKFSPAIWKTTMAAFGNVDEIDAKVAAKARTMRVAASSKAKNGKTIEVKALANSYAESALYLTTMGQGTVKAPKKYVDVLFSQERLPYTEGWRMSKSPVGLPALLQTFEILRASESVRKDQNEAAKKNGQENPATGMSWAEVQAQSILAGVVTAVNSVTKGAWGVYNTVTGNGGKEKKY